MPCLMVSHPGIPTCIITSLWKRQKNANEQGDENYKRLRRNYLISYNRTIPALRQADHCIHCNACLSHCPQKINIPQELEKIGNFIEQLKREGR